MKVFGYIITMLLAIYQKGDFRRVIWVYLLINEANVDQIKAGWDSTTLRCLIHKMYFKGAGRNPISGKKKGGLKSHACLSILNNMVPELVG